MKNKVKYMLILLSIIPFVGSIIYFSKRIILKRLIRKTDLTIIGGSDGPTSIYISHKVNSYPIYIFVIVIIITVYLYMWRKRKNR